MKAVDKAGENDLAKYTMSIAVMITGTAAHKIRKYEEAGLCKPARTACKQRLFTDGELKLIKTISNLEEDGVNLAGIKIILDMKEGRFFKKA